MKIKLHVAIRVPGERPREFDLEFTGPEILIGRDRESDIQIPLSSVSRKHAKVVQRDNQWFVEDLASTHGTKVNGQLIGSEGKKLLREGDVIEIVQASISFHLVDETKIEEAGDEKTAVVAQKMVSGILSNPTASSDLPYLLVMNGPKEGSKISIAADIQEFLIGRGETADLRIDDVNVSRRHAKLRREWNELVIEDLGSKNGVIVNGRKISAPTRLKDADEIYLGAVHLTFIDPTASIIDRLEEMVAFAGQTPAKETTLANEPQEAPQVTVSTPEPPTTEETPAVLQNPPLEQTANSAASLSNGLGVTEIILVALAVTVLAGLVYGILLLLT